MGTVVTTKRLSRWRYESLPRWGVCSLGKTDMRVRLSLSVDGGNIFPDVDEVEAWMAETMRQPTTAEYLAVAAAARWGADAEVLLEAATHGPITACCDAPD